MSKLSEELAQRVEERGTDFHAIFTEAEAADLAAGYVPLSVRGTMRAMLDWRDDDRRRAERPVQARKRA